MQTAAMACYSVSKVFRKETAFPFWRAMNMCCKKYVVSFVFSVTTVMQILFYMSAQYPCNAMCQLYYIISSIRLIISISVPHHHNL